MPPRTPSAIYSSIWNLSSLLQTLPTSTSASRPAAVTKCSACLFSSSTHLESIRVRRHKRKSQDPYREAQARQRKNANLARQKVLQSERQAALGDPVRSKPTPFIQSLRSPQSIRTQTSPPSSSFTPFSDINNNSDRKYLNFYLDAKTMATQIEHSKWLTEPIPQQELTGTRTIDDEELDKNNKQAHEKGHQAAERALRSITALDAGSSKDRTRINVQRCIAEFGRHNTDAVLAPKPASLLPTNARPPPALSEAEAAAVAELAAIPKRVGADTGSSEVQIAILTTKINVLADNLGKKDKNNKRNLRLLVHRRQKLLNYLRRKERGGPRWMNLVEKLGINDGMWKGEISM